MLNWLFLLLTAPLGGYIVWHALGIVLSAVARRTVVLPASALSCPGQVALLYLTCNDFNASACATLLEQQGIDGDVFILDDSTQISVRQRIDAWVRTQDSTVRVVRRADRSGYKGGNINHWLAAYGDPAVYFAVLLVDADEHIPAHFTHRLLACLTAGQYAFVQACHLGTAELCTPFQELLHPQVECEWWHQVPMRNFSGIPPMLGHGVMLRTTSLLAVGGFPDLVSEDMALTIRLAEQGFTGVIATHILGREAFPRSYHAYWRRRRRWIQADAEIVRKMLWELWQKCPGWGARFDLSVRELRLPIASFYWILLSAMACMAILRLEWHIVVSPWTWSLLPLLLVPALPAFGMTRLAWSRRMLYVCTMTFVGAATSALHPVATLGGLWGYRVFEPTGSPNQHRSEHASFWLWWEVCSGLVWGTGGFWDNNWSLVAIGLATGWSGVMRRQWEMPGLASGVMIFWALLLYQIYVDVINGFVPIEHLLALIGLAITMI